MSSLKLQFPQTLTGRPTAWDQGPGVGLSACCSWACSLAGRAWSDQALARLGLVHRDGNCLLRILSFQYLYGVMRASGKSPYPPQRLLLDCFCLVANLLRQACHWMECSWNIQAKNKQNVLGMHSYLCFRVLSAWIITKSNLTQGKKIKILHWQWHTHQQQNLPMKIYHSHIQIHPALMFLVSMSFPKLSCRNMFSSNATVSC